MTPANVHDTYGGSCLPGCITVGDVKQAGRDAAGTRKGGMVTPQKTPTRSGPLVRRLVLVMGFGALAFVLTAVVGGIWSALLTINLAMSPAIPWAVVVMALLLWLLWRYLGGAWWPRTPARGAGAAGLLQVSTRHRRPRAVDGLAGRRGCRGGRIPRLLSTSEP
ncbi:MAG: hypothetical protein ACLQUY_07280 [Ktedonobacterales bacterium]